MHKAESVEPTRSLAPTISQARFKQVTQWQWLEEMFACAFYLLSSGLACMPHQSYGLTVFFAGVHTWDGLGKS